MTITAKPVEVLGCAVGNLWDIFVDCVFYVRVTYHGNSLVRVKTKTRGVVTVVPTTKEIEQAIDAVYRSVA
jgi:hypothetical protein